MFKRLFLRTLRILVFRCSPVNCISRVSLDTLLLMFYFVLATNCCKMIPAEPDDSLRESQVRNADLFSGKSDNERLACFYAPPMTLVVMGQSLTRTKPFSFQMLNERH
ncbi:hypothetical protein GALMADRAFT_1034069 [Galerina marginata CBS 339.88]|uniref:Uncharacterized protein n=1 Tax=Galerina marginata (strain CBS 339.88) TaxID=685588 RepID=A0A067SC80_GALM3|nr:hypothetical protein GALMADRAFT_1034069 [Galerina marginata CBS 339.88]